MFDLVKLKTFVYVAQSMSFSEAATNLHLTQPTISHHIKILERELGVKLFDRSAGGLRLTEAGTLLQPYARNFIREAYDILQMMGSLEDRIVGRLVIACSTTTAAYILPQLAARFHREQPGVAISITPCSYHSVLPKLLSEEVDIGVVSYDAGGQGLECQEFFDDRITLIVPANHRWASRQHIEPADLLEAPLIMREPTSGTCRAVLIELSKHGIKLGDLDIHLEIGNSEAIVRTVAAGFGVAYVSRLAAEWALDQGLVVAVHVSDCAPRRKIYLIKNELQEPHRCVEAFWGYIHHPANADLLRLAEG